MPDRRDVRARYDTLSRYYDVIAGWTEQPARDRGLARLAPAAGERIVEVGVGTGRTAAALARAVGPLGMVVAVDVSAGMLRRTVARGGPSLHAARACCGDAVALPLRAGAFDAACMIFTLELLPDGEMAQAAHELARVLRPGGRACVVSLSSAGAETMARRWYVRGHQAFPGALDCRPIAVKPVLESAGFSSISVDSMRLWGLPVDVVTGCRT
ncbi:MAG: methyltransferase domain-containing protein [Deltaproteobacteria bacterium]|nr:methyltransferase domain-containing protein [Deltaproteobacteria bacterium]